MNNSTKPEIPKHIKEIIATQALTGLGKDTMKIQIASYFDYTEEEFDKIWAAHCPQETGLKKAAYTGMFAALLIAIIPAAACASSACLEPRPASDSAQYVHVIDKDGKVHRLSLFVLGEEDEPEFTLFLSSRKLAAMDPGRNVYVKGADSLHTFKAVLDCPKKARKALKL